MNGISVRLWGKTGVSDSCETTGSECIVCVGVMLTVSSFITRSDIEDMKSAGLNSLRIPVGYWSVDLLDYEPYVSGQVGRVLSQTLTSSILT